MAFSFISCSCSLSRGQDVGQGLGEPGDNQVNSPAVFVPKHGSQLSGVGRSQEFREPFPRQIVGGLKLRVGRREDDFVGIHSPFFYPWKAFTSW